MTRFGYENLKKDDEPQILEGLSTNEEKSYSTLQLGLIIIGSMFLGIVIYDILFAGNIWCGISKLMSSKDTRGFECKDFGNATTGLLTS